MKRTGLGLAAVCAILTACGTGSMQELVEDGARREASISKPPMEVAECTEQKIDVESRKWGFGPKVVPVTQFRSHGDTIKMIGESDGYFKMWSIDIDADRAAIYGHTEGQAALLESFVIACNTGNKASS